MVSSYIARLFVDLAVFTEGIRQVDLYQPWAQMFEELMIDKREGIEKEFSERSEVLRALLAAVDLTQAAAFGTPERGRFFYPVEKPRNKKNVNAMRAAEANLDEFWIAVDYMLRKTVGSKMADTALRKVLSKPRILQRTSPWDDPKKDGKDLQNQAVVEPLLQTLSELYLNLDRKRDGTTGHKILKENASRFSKAKTHGVAASAASPEHPYATPSALPDIQPIFTIDARALKVFRTLFYTPSVGATPGEVAWTDFLHAMHCTGFVPEKLYGSVWQFTPTKLDVERSIQFYEPHPVGKLPYKTARRFGRRLERAYGWISSMFALKEKSAEQ